MTARRALLIASPHKGLRGCLNDVKMMEEMLGTFGFAINKCCDTAATREGILLALEKFEKGTSLGDTVVVYYSGHGGLVESQLNIAGDTEASDMFRPWRYQFLVPVDYHQSTPSDFRGLLDIELSEVLHRICSKTKNVTVLLDCCHARFMARDPGLGDRAVSKSVATVGYDNILQHVSKLKTPEGRGKGLKDEENTPFVSIAAASATETAWEYRNSSNEWCGALTEALVKVLSQCRGQRITWKASLFRISELVGVNFPGQHPCLLGPGNRFHFSLEESTSEGLYIRHEAEDVAIQAGTISGVLEKNTYSVMNHGAKVANTRNQIAEAQVIHATAFKAIVSLRFCRPGVTRLPDEGATAFLRHSVIPKWPVKDTYGVQWLGDMYRRSNFVRPQDPTESGFALATIRRESNHVALYTNFDLQVTRVPIDASHENQLKFQAAVERLARARHLLGLKNETDAECLHYQGRFEFRVLENSSIRRSIHHDGTDSVVENTFTCITLANNGPETIHVSVFNVNAIGVISRVSRREGIELPPGRPEIILRRRNPPVGLQITWPEGIPRIKPLEETLLFIVTSSPVDLCHLADSPAQSTPSYRTGLSRLEQLTSSIASGCYRDGKGVEDDEDTLRYAIYRIPFSLIPESFRT